MSVEDCEHAGCPSTDYTYEHMETAKSSTKTDKVPFQRLLAGQASHMELACEL
jgi:hypothetical protein